MSTYEFGTYTVSHPSSTGRRLTSLTGTGRPKLNPKTLIGGPGSRPDWMNLPIADPFAHLEAPVKDYRDDLDEMISGRLMAVNARKIVNPDVRQFRGLKDFITSANPMIDVASEQISPAVEAMENLKRSIANL